MKYLFYNNYCTGRSGLSNCIMSMELGAIFAHLTERVLVIEGNVPAPVNLVPYDDGRVSNTHRSRYTDLFEMAVPWIEHEQIDLSSRTRQELSPESLLDSVFYYPAGLDLGTPDFESFRQGRPYAFTYPDTYRDVEVLALSGGPAYGKQRYKLYNLGFYSTLFYLDAEAERSVRDLLRRLRPKGHFTALADKVARALGDFNAVHIRRGDFKRSPGKSVLLREPREAVERLNHNFGRGERLVILTDEIGDPFCQEVLACYPDHVVLDRFILDEFGKDFIELPHHDGLALAFLCQLVATDARDFVGTMTSTFTSLIQRWRGNKGRDERFKFLWNEVPAAGAEMLPGSTAKNDDVPLHPNGEMVRQYEGPYSWNHYCPRIDTGWMREWPESFIGA